MVTTDARLIAQIQNNFISYFRLFAGQPGVTFVDEDATWFCNGPRDGPGDYILRANFGAASAAHDIDRLLARIGEEVS